MENQSTAGSSKAEKAEKKQYFDKKFKKSLTKALKTNRGEPGNIEKIQNTTHTLREYSTERIAEFINRTSSDVQKSVEISLSAADPDAKRCSTLATFLASMPASDNSINNGRCDELKLVMKLCSESQPNIKCEPMMKVPGAGEEAVDFVALNKFLYTAVSGNPDVNSLNAASLAVLNDTLRLLNEQVDVAIESDQFVDDLKSKLFQNKPSDTNSHPELAHLFKNPSFNPLSLPIDYFVHEESTASREEPLEDVEMRDIKVEKCEKH